MICAIGMESSFCERIATDGATNTMIRENRDTAPTRPCSALGDVHMDVVVSTVPMFISLTVLLGDRVEFNDI